MLIKNYYGMGECPECHEDIPDDAKAGDTCECGEHVFTDKYKKVIVGYVVQNYKTLPNGTRVCTDQEFIAGDVSYESVEYGDGLDYDDFDTLEEVDCPLLMVQPKQIPIDERDWHILEIHDLRDGKVSIPYSSKEEAKTEVDKLTADEDNYDIAYTVISVPCGTQIGL